jgi:hypothetical protein
MGTASTKKIIKNNAGTLTEEAALLTSAGAGDANRVPALNASGVLDATIVNSKTTSAGAGDSGKLPALDAAGKLDTSFMPTGIGADTSSIVSSENLAAGDLVNIWNNTGTANVRKADAAVAGKEAHGFVLAAVTSPAAATVYFEGSNTGVTGLTPGPQFLSATAGLCTATAPSAAGNVVQRVGFATSATNVNFQSQTPVVLA